MKFFKLKSWMLGIGILLISLSAFAQNDKEVQDAYFAWCNAVGEAKGDPKVVVKYYAPDASLLATLSPKILINTDGGLNDYFASFTKNTNIKCKTDKLITHVEGDVAYNVGLYTFTYDEGKNKKVVPARFTFVYKKYNNGWLIVHHHSSKLP